MTNSTRRLAGSLVAGGALLMATGAPVSAQDDDQEYTGTIAPMNDSGASGDVTITVDGSMITVTANMAGVADQVHAQHLHGEVGFDGSCPTPDLDEDGDGIVNTAEGVPNYGTVKVSLTTEGETSEAYALAVESFPVGSGGSYTYTRSIEVGEDLAAGVGDLLYVVHGADLDGSGEYDGDAKSPLSDDLPLEATVPIGCAKLVVSASTPTGGVAAGGGGAATSSDSSTLVTGGLLAALVGGAVLMTNRRRLTR